MATQTIPRLTPEEYLELERKNEFRSEYVDGQMIAMAGASLTHNQIVSNVQGELYAQLRGRHCGCLGSDMRIYFPEFGVYSYPDIAVVCGTPKLYGDRQDIIADATIAIEVLSPSTKNYDRAQKFDYYRSLPSFTEYLLLAQDRMRAEHHVRLEDGSWLYRDFTAPNALVELRSIGCRLELQTLYQRVELTTAENPAIS